MHLFHGHQERTHLSHTGPFRIPRRGRFPCCRFPCCRFPSGCSLTSNRALAACSLAFGISVAIIAGSALGQDATPARAKSPTSQPKGLTTPSNTDSRDAFERDHEVLRQKLIGTWRIVSASIDGKASELHRTSITLKLVTPTHMIWIGYQPEDRRIFRSAGGSWKVLDGRYVETMRYGLDATFREGSFGKSFGFDCRFEGNRWIQSGTMPGGVFLEEIWERLEPDEDVSAWPSPSEDTKP